MAHVFISYASADRDRIQPLVEALTAAGLEVWWDRNISQGQNFGRLIEEALEQASCVVAAWTHASVDSEWVCNEASEARKLGKLVPVLLDDVEMPLEFRHLHAGRLVGWKGNTDAPPFRETLAAVLRLAKLKPGVRAASPVPPGDRLASIPTRLILAVALLLGGIGVLLIGLKQVGLVGGTLDAGAGEEVDQRDTVPAATAGTALAETPAASAATASAPTAATPDSDLPLDELNLLSSGRGGKILQANQTGWEELVLPSLTYRSLSMGGFAVFELGGGKPTRFDTFATHVVATNEYNIKELALLVSDESPDGPFRRVAQISIPNVRNMQNPYHAFPVGPVSARYVKFQVVSLQNGANAGGYLGNMQLLNLKRPKPPSR